MKKREWKFAGVFIDNIKENMMFSMGIEVEDSEGCTVQNS